MSVFQKVASKAAEKGYAVAQIKGPGHTEIPGIPSLTFNLRMMLAVFEHAEKCFCGDTFVQHARAAIRKPSTVAWMVRSPKTWGYTMHTNIEPALDDNLRYQVENYALQFDQQGTGARQKIDTTNAFDFEQIIQSLEL